MSHKTKTEVDRIILQINRGHPGSMGEAVRFAQSLHDSAYLASLYGNTIRSAVLNKAADQIISALRKFPA